MLTVKAPGIEFSIPSEWEEVTLKQFLTVHSKQRQNEQQEVYYILRDLLEAFASDVAMLHQLGDVEETKLINALPFIRNMPDFASLPVPQRIAGVEPIQDLSSGTLLQKWSVEELLKERKAEEEPTDFVSMAVPLLAIYLYPLLTGELLTDTDQIVSITDQIEALPCTEALPLAAFFLNRLSNLTSSGQASFSYRYPKPQPRKSLRQRFRDWMPTPSLRLLPRWLRRKA